jgi:peptidoglycan/xylan/chitin deacetylase (PgdA/CDA1 family)
MKIPVLMYHEVANNEDVAVLSRYINRRYIVETATFESQLKYLVSRNYRVATVSDLPDLPGNTDQKIVVLTFDDGYAGNFFKAYQLLKQLNFKATFYIVTNWVGLPHMLTWQQIREMSENGMEIGSHTCSHALLGTVSEEHIDQELSGSKNEIENKIQKEVKSLSYPNGSFSNRVNEIALKIGYKVACTSEFGYADLPYKDFSLPRLRAENNLLLFSKGVEQNKFYILRKTVGAALKKTLVNILGKKTYNKLYLKIFNIKEINSQ